MKDIEKIKSEDLAAQVQDANPANFAIEQEVAQLVGATVPAPTEPSADDARELGAQLLVFLRRALTPIQTALRTALAAIYAHLDSRCTAYTPAAYAPYQPLPSYDPMGTPPTPRTLPNLLTAITAFSARKISGVPEAADGMSLLHLLNDLSGITELTDDNVGWTASGNEIKALIAKCPNLTKMQSKAAQIVISGYSSVFDRLGDVDFRYASVRGTSWGYGLFAFGTHSQPVNLKIKEINTSGDTEILYGAADIVNLYCERIITGWHTYILHAGSVVRELNMKDTYYIESTQPAGYHNIYLVGQSSVTAEALEIVRFGTMHKMDKFYLYDSATYNPVNLTLIEFGEGTDCNINLSTWNPTDKGTTFLQNFREHIALRLTANGSGKTLTLSQAVRDAIHAAEATYGIEAIIVTQKGWTISPAPGASSQ